MRTCMVLLDWPRPEPWQVSQGWSTTRPRPLHSVQGSVIAKTPPWTEVCMPVPSHFRQTFGTVPYFAPVPRPPPNMPPRMSPSPPPPVEPDRLNRSPTSKPNPCPPPWALPPGIRNPPLPNSRRASSYSLRFLVSPTTSYASETSLNLASADASPALESGWYLR